MQGGSKKSTHPGLTNGANRKLSEGQRNERRPLSRPLSTSRSDTLGNIRRLGRAMLVAREDFREDRTKAIVAETGRIL